MEKAVKQKKKDGGGMLSDFMLRILAVIFAVVIWFAMSITQFPTISKTITSVPVDFSLHGTTAESRGLSALGYKDITVDVEIQGMNYEIGAYNANDLVASVDLDSVTKEGTYELNIEVKSAHSTDNCTILSVKPETVSVKFDQIDTVKLPLDVSAPNVSAAEGFTLKETQVDPAEIEIEGPENELEKIDKVTAVYSGELSLSEDQTVSTNTIIFYDADDNILNSANYTTKVSTVDLTFVIYKQVTVELDAAFSNVPPGFDLGSMPYSLSVDALQIITPQLNAETTEQMTLSPISLYDITKGKTFKTEIDSLLSTGEINQTSVDQVELSFDFTDYDQKTFSIPASRVTITNAPVGKTTSLDSATIPNVTIFGPKAEIDGLTVNDLTAVIDLSNVSASGSVSHEVIIYSSKYNDMWNIGTHEAAVTIAEPTTSSSADSASSAAEASAAAASDSTSAEDSSTPSL